MNSKTHVAIAGLIENVLDLALILTQRASPNYGELITALESRSFDDETLESFVSWIVSELDLVPVLDPRERLQYLAGVRVAALNHMSRSGWFGEVSV